MSNGSGWITVSAIASCILAVYALLNGMDLCFLVLECISILALFLPSLLHLGYGYSERIGMVSVFPPVAMLMVIAAGYIVPDMSDISFWNITLFTYLLQSMQVVQAFMAGFMIMTVVSNTGGFRITKRWMILASMFIALSYGVLCMFGYFIGMYFAGDEVFHKVGGYVAQEYNALMMSTCFISTFVSAISAFLAVRMTRGLVVEDFITRGDGHE